jgi:hypothetical protein
MIQEQNQQVGLRRGTWMGESVGSERYHETTNVDTIAGGNLSQESDN